MEASDTISASAEESPKNPAKQPEKILTPAQKRAARKAEREAKKAAEIESQVIEVDNDGALTIAEQLQVGIDGLRAMKVDRNPAPQAYKELVALVIETTGVTLLESCLSRRGISMKMKR